MEEITYKRLLRWTLASFIAVVMIAYGFGVGIASAETGTILLDDEVTYTHVKASGGQGSTFLWGTINYDSANYNYISSFHVTSPGFSFSQDFNSTAFTITSGGTGGGNVWYDKNWSTVYYVFSTTSTFTSSPIVLSFSKDIFSQITQTVGDGNEDVSSTKPICIKRGATPCASNTGGLTYQSTVSTRATDTYSVIYPNTNYFDISIDKNTAVNTKYKIYGGVSTYSTETSFNKVDINNATFLYNDGIYLNTSLASGYYVLTTINITGDSGTVQPGESPSDNINPSTGVGIVFDKSSYALGDIANISWIRNINTPFGDTDYIVVINPNGTEDEIISSPPDTGYYKVLMSPAGTWKVEFRRSSLLFGVSVLDSDTATVGAETPSYIYAPAQVASGKLFNVTYKVGFTQTASPWIKTYRWIGSDWVYEQAFSITAIKDVEANTSILVKSTGKYLIKLCDNLLGCKASTSTTSYFNGSEPTLNITISNITIDKTAYSYGEYISTSVYVDNSNWSNKAISVDYINYDTGITNNQQYIQNQVESFNLYVSDFVFPAPGNSALRLIGKNDTGTYVLAYKNFTLSSLDAEGYGLSILGNQSCTGDTGQIKVVVPSGEVANLSISADNAIYNKDYVMNGSKIVPYTFKISGTYYITLRVNNEAKRLIIVNIKSCVVATTTTTPSVSETSNDIVSLFSQKIFWALIFIVGLALMVAKRERKG